MNELEEQYLRTLHRYLHKLANCKEGYDGGSICSHASRVSKWVDGKFNKFLRECFRNWPKYSGNVNYPVPHNTMDSYSAYYYAYEEGLLWSGQYGQDRRGLCHHIVHQLGGVILSGKGLGGIEFKNPTQLASHLDAFNKSINKNKELFNV